MAFLISATIALALSVYFGNKYSAKIQLLIAAIRLKFGL